MNTQIIDIDTYSRLTYTCKYKIETYCKINAVYRVINGVEIFYLAVRVFILFYVCTSNKKHRYFPPEAPLTNARVNLKHPGYILCPWQT